MKKDKKSMLEFLAEEGFRPKIDDDGDINIQYNCKTIYIFLDKEDDSFIRIANYSIIDGFGLNYKLAHDITLKYKLGKCSIVKEDSLAFNVETIESMESFQKNFSRYLKIILNMEENYAEQVAKDSLLLNEGE